jgi:hypothetical protein
MATRVVAPFGSFLLQLGLILRMRTFIFAHLEAGKSLEIELG